MKANEARFLDVLSKSRQFVIPIYQRTYSWTRDECQQMWDDIVRVGNDDAVLSHFVGAIVYIEQGLSNLTSQEPMLVIDGQQRLTTITLILAALERALEKLGDGLEEPVDGFAPKKIHSYYLENSLETGDRRYKLILSQTDKMSLIAIVNGDALPKECSIRVVQNFTFFESLFADPKIDLRAVCRGLAKLVVVDIALNPAQDNPQLIFESMNSTGKELSQADLIRNFILMGLDTTIQTRLYEQHWHPMEIAFGQEHYAIYFDGFMRNYLTVKTREIPRNDDIYKAFKKYARRPDVAAAGVESLVKDVREFADHFCALALGAEPDQTLKIAFQDLRELKVDVAYPFLMELYHDYCSGLLARQDLLAVVRLVESYVFRRAVCSIPSNALNKIFANFWKNIKKDRYLESVQAHFLTMPTQQRFPSDSDFRREIQKRDLYNFGSRSYWMLRMENFKRKERVNVGEYTIEHILPNSADDINKLPTSWRVALGEDWERIWTDCRNTLGNLTLTGYNSEYSNKPFIEKRDMVGGFSESPLHLNVGLGQADAWNEESIKVRAEKLSERAISVWAEAKLPTEILDTYRSEVNLTSYSINDHRYILSGAMRDLFESFRREVLAIDPCITEEFLKLYVAYRAETNFVDIIPQAKRLRLSLNMKFADIHDPRGLCRDISKVARWGNGDVEIGFSTAEEIPYIISLVRQSFERQMGIDADIVA